MTSIARPPALLPSSSLALLSVSINSLSVRQMSPLLPTAATNEPALDNKLIYVEPG